MTNTLDKSTEQLIEEAVKEFTDFYGELYKRESGEQYETESGGVSNIYFNRAWGIEDFFRKRLNTIASKSAEETARYCISISEMTDEQMTHLEEKYGFTLKEPPIPHFITEYAGRIMKNGKWVLEEALETNNTKE